MLESPNLQKSQTGVVDLSQNVFHVILEPDRAWVLTQKGKYFFQLPVLIELNQKKNLIKIWTAEFVIFFFGKKQTKTFEWGIVNCSKKLLDSKIAIAQ